MLIKASTANGTTQREAGYLEAIEECLKEIVAIRKGMKKTDTEIRQLRASSRRKLDETWEIIHRVQATV
jgi:hypothetical protein